MRKEAEPMGRKKTSKTREMGILAKASKEFEESGEETPDTPDASAASPTEPNQGEQAQSQPEHQPTPQPDLQGKCPEPPGPRESCPPEGAGPGHGQREPVPSASADRMFFDVPVLILVSDSDGETQEVDTYRPIRDEGAFSQLQQEEVKDAGQMEPVPCTSAAHMFLFDNESQEVVEASQPIRDEGAFSQLQLEEVKRRIKALMKRTNQSLESVTKALLKTSGDWSATLRYLVDGEGAGPFWDRRDDRLLLAGHTSELHGKYGEEDVAKRLAFLDAV